jgi:hypothetical protein
MSTATELNVNIIEFLNKSQEEREEYVKNLRKIADCLNFKNLQANITDEIIMGVSAEKLSIPNNPTDPEAWEEIRRQHMDVYKQCFGDHDKNVVEITRHCDTCEKKLELTTPNVDYTCSVCDFKSDICQECQDLLFPEGALSAEQFDRLRKQRILNQCPDGVGCQNDGALKCSANQS